MKNKKGFVFGILPLIYMGLALSILVALIIFGVRINEGLTAFFGFLKDWWWAIALTIAGLLWHKQITAIVNKILSYFGVKV